MEKEFTTAQKILSDRIANLIEKSGCDSYEALEVLERIIGAYLYSEGSRSDSFLLNGIIPDIRKFSKEFADRKLFEKYPNIDED